MFKRKTHATVSYLEPVKSIDERKEKIKKEAPGSLTDDVVVARSIHPIKEFYFIDIAQ
jgi:hypothetical protein